MSSVSPLLQNFWNSLILWELTCKRRLVSVLQFTFAKLLLVFMYRSKLLYYYIFKGSFPNSYREQQEFRIYFLYFLDFQILYHCYFPPPRVLLLLLLSMLCSFRLWFLYHLDYGFLCKWVFLFLYFYSSIFYYFVPLCVTKQNTSRILNE